MSLLEGWRLGELPPTGVEFYDDLANAPVDIVIGVETEEDWERLDGDNSKVGEAHDLGLEGVPVERMTAPETRMLLRPLTLVVPLPRTLKKGMRGKDVFALQRAISAAGYRKWGTFTYFFGDGTHRQLQKFQAANGLRADGVYGPTTHAKMMKHYDRYGQSLMLQMQKQLSVTPRDKIKAYATHGYNKRAYIHYTQSSLRMYGVKHKVKIPGIPYWEDCSSFATWCYWGAGVRDPNGLGYSGYGYTGTLASHGRRTWSPRVGDLAFYGGFPHNHVTIYIGNGRAISHGSEVGPLLVYVTYRTVNQYRSYL